MPVNVVGPVATLFVTTLQTVFDSHAWVCYNLTMQVYLIDGSIWNIDNKGELVAAAFSVRLEALLFVTLTSAKNKKIFNGVYQPSKRHRCWELCRN